jgi:C4-dicarboxylate-specific signal transduction histidine kinase
VHAAVAESTRAVDRITEVLRNLRRFARSEGVGAPQPTEVRPVVEEALQQTAARLRGIQLERALGEPLPQVTVRRRRLVQVLGNLLLNAADAVEAPQAKERRIRVGAHAAADGVSVWVEDSGRGLSPEVLAHLFEPFFTTKSPGQGTGLGLALSREFVEADGGTLNLEPSPGGGTRAVVKFPSTRGTGLPDTDAGRVA